MADLTVEKWVILSAVGLAEKSVAAMVAPKADEMAELKAAQWAEDSVEWTVVLSEMLWVEQLDSLVEKLVDLLVAYWAGSKAAY